MAAISFVTNKRFAAMLLPRATAIACFRFADLHGESSHCDPSCRLFVREPPQWGGFTSWQSFNTGNELTPRSNGIAFVILWTFAVVLRGRSPSTRHALWMDEVPPLFLWQTIAPYCYGCGVLS